MDSRFLNRYARIAVMHLFCVCVLTAALLFPIRDAAAALDYTFTNGNDSGPGSLRAVIAEVNAEGAGSYEINCSGGPFTITLVTELPVITCPGAVFLNGGGSTIDGSAVAGAAGLTLQSSGHTVHGFTIVNCAGAGIEIDNSDSNTITGCYIGNNGTTAAGNGDGIVVEGENNTIGGAGAGEGNIISGNTLDGVRVLSGSDGAKILGNYIGINGAGDAALPNGHNGIMLYSDHVTVGGTSQGEGNVISGNSYQGINCGGGGNHIIQGNKIGTDSSGTAAIPNVQNGIWISKPNVTVGGTTAGSRKVISGNTEDGIYIIGNGAPVDSVVDTVIQGNFIGVDATGRAALPNGEDGIYALYGDDFTIGGTAAGAGNVISGNAEKGIRLASVTGATIQGNYIGVCATGAFPLPNGHQGVQLVSETTNIMLGGASSSAGNCIAYNDSYGVYVHQDASAISIRRNSIFGHAGAFLGIKWNTPIVPAPVITGVGSVEGTSVAGATIDIFADDDDEGRLYVDTVTADGAGHWHSDADLRPFGGLNLQATATLAGNTSEFSAGTAVPASDPVWCFIMAPGGFEVANGADVALGDLNFDGYLDVFFANSGSTPNQVFLNSGSGGTSFSDTGQALGSGDSVAVALGRLNDDLTLDAFVVNYSGGCEVWTSKVSGVFTNSGQSLTGDYAADVALGDLDDDGDLDAYVVYDEDTPDRVWFNQGGVQEDEEGTFASGLDLGSDDGRAVALGDLDGDGDLDAFVVNNSGDPDRVWLNNGHGSFTDSGQSLDPGEGDGVALGDLDGDGDLDAVVANDDGGSDTVWINQGGSQGGAQGVFLDSGQALGDTSSRDVALGDIDRDGDLDLFVAGSEGANTVWWNDGAGVFTDSGQRLGSSGTLGVALGDINNDSRLDAVAANAGSDIGHIWVQEYVLYQTGFNEGVFPPPG